MTTLKDTLQADLQTALKARDELTVSTLRGIIGAINTEEKGGKKAVEFNDDQIIALLNRQVKQRNKTAEEFTQVGATDRAERELAEAEVIAKYVPAQMTEDEIRQIVAEVLAEFDAPTAADFGKIMKGVTAKTKGRADGRLVSEIVRSSY